MPELAEVETVKEKLKPRLLNKRICDVDIYWPNIIADIDIDEFKSKLKDQVFIDIKRRGKWLLFELTSYYLLINLRMEGKFFFKGENEELIKHEHVVFKLNDVELRYHDTRKFGKMYIRSKKDLLLTKPLIDLGLEPFDENLTVEYLKNKFKNKRLPIKTVLLDQKIIVGIGNIYADEILFSAEVDPYKKVQSLTNKELKKIIEATRRILKKAIELGGTTIRTYVSLDGQKGMYQKELCVHNRKGDPCLKCGTIIVKDFVGGRGTYYCPKCQR